MTKDFFSVAIIGNAGETVVTNVFHFKFRELVFTSDRYIYIYSQEFTHWAAMVTILVRGMILVKIRKNARSRVYDKKIMREVVCTSLLRV